MDSLNENGGKLKTDTTKPRLSLEQKQDRVNFAKKWLKMLKEDEKETDEEKEQVVTKLATSKKTDIEYK